MGKLYYCKWCGTKNPTVSGLTSQTCMRHPNKGKHELYEGSEKSMYVCKYCGTKNPTIAGLTSQTCMRHPNKGKHEPAL